MAVLRQQLAFVERLKHSGMLSETEADLMADPIDATTRVVHSPTLTIHHRIDL